MIINFLRITIKRKAREIKYPVKEGLFGVVGLENMGM